MQTKNNIKIVILSAFYEPFMSGAEQMVKEISEKLGDFYDITIITGRFNKKLEKIEQRENFKIIRVGIGNKVIDKILYPILSNFVILKIKPNIVHAIMESYAGVALIFTKYFYSKAKRILTLQSGDLDDNRKQRKFFIKLFWKSIHKSPDIITAISYFLANRAIKLGVDEKDIYVIPNGVDFSKIPQNIDKVKNRVLCVARLSWEKGIDYLVKAWKELIVQIPDAKLVLVGEGNKRYEIEKLIKDLNLESSIELKGNLSHEKTLIEISKSEVFVCPSLAEGLGIVFIEAQACNVSVIGTKVGGIPDIIVNNENGLLIESKNSEQITNSIIKLLNSEELRNKFIENAKKSVLKYDWGKIVEQISNLYKF
ncbi:MAG: glycosyltransferase family 4 protein [Patescibacteria group bacterium]|nr:glycosyltransferase family 4 protein [Patescibacteria group bacterium]MDD4304275.1 glycosyltransferase family 4 protein [Patescibacteria group bacterium]MDD4695329.1 glycosyltransferase family 4 protein [Patescibacteria group bacterium]